MRSELPFAVRLTEGKVIRMCSAVFLISLAVLPVAGAQGSKIPEDVKETIRTRVDSGYNVAIVVGIVDPGGREFYSYGSTARDAEQRPNERTVFEIGSFTKAFTGLLLADMAHREEVALDDPIEKHLPGNVQAPRRNGHSITLAHLATHTSGLPRMPGNMALTDPSNPYADYSVEQMYEFLSGHTLRRDIGEQYEYSNYGMGLLGHILALASGMSYEELVAQRIANELGMRDTGIALTARTMKRLAKGHSGNTEVPNWDFPTLAGAGALRSSADDMLTFLAANMGLEESRLSSAMKTAQESRHEAGLPTMSIGLGWHILAIDDRQLIWHNGGTGGYYCFAGFVRAEGKGVVVLTNSSQTVDDIGFHLLEPQIPLSELDPDLPLRMSELLAEPVNVDLALGEKLRTGNEIMRRYIECIGGPDALGRAQNRSVSMTIAMKSLGITGTIVISQARPNKYYARMEIPRLVTTEMGTDGQVVWELSSMSGGRILKGKERAAMLLHYRFDDMEYEQLYRKIESVGMQKIGEEVCYEVVFAPKEAGAFTGYFSKASGLMIKTVIVLPHRSGQLKVESFMSDYREIDGILYPHQVIERVMNIDTHCTLAGVKHNVDMPEDRFEPPAEIKNLLERSEQKETGDRET